MISMLKQQGLGKDRRQVKDSVGFRKQPKEWFFKSTDHMPDRSDKEWLFDRSSHSQHLPSPELIKAWVYSLEKWNPKFWSVWFVKDNRNWGWTTSLKTGVKFKALCLVLCIPSNFSDCSCDSSGLMKLLLVREWWLPLCIKGN